MTKTYPSPTVSRKLTDLPIKGTLAPPGVFKIGGAMITISSFRDLERFGIETLTGEVCGLSYRVLCDVTEKGRKLLQKCLGLPDLKLSAPWNSGSTAEPHTGSFMMPPEMFVPFGVFALLESGCSEVWLYRNNGLLGVEPGDSEEQIELARKMCPESLLRSFKYDGTAADRNVHVMTGRTI